MEGDKSKVRKRKETGRKCKKISGGEILMNPFTVHTRSLCTFPFSPCVIRPYFCRIFHVCFFLQFIQSFETASRSCLSLHQAFPLAGELLQPFDFCFQLPFLPCFSRGSCLEKRSSKLRTWTAFAQFLCSLHVQPH